MPHVSVYIDSSDVLDDLSDDELIEELESRKKKKSLKAGIHQQDPDTQIPVGAARALLDDLAWDFRDKDKFDIAFKLDEIRMDYLNL